jgi:ABC-type uncharacterized transport system permease subunit
VKDGERGVTRDSNTSKSLTLGDRMGISGLDGALAGALVGLVAGVLSRDLWITLVAATAAGVLVAAFADRLWALIQSDGAEQEESSSRD